MNSSSKLFFSCIVLVFVAIATHCSSLCSAQPSTKKATTNEKDPDPAAEIELWAPRKLEMNFGMTFYSNDNQCSQLFATIPFPKDWPEQKVTILSANLPDNARYRERDVPGGAKQLILEAAALGPQQTMEILVSIDIEKSFIKAPTQPETLVFPKKTLRDRDLVWYLGDSPMIETKSRAIREIVVELKGQNPPHAWAYVESIYDWVRTNIDYRLGEIRSTKETLKDKWGDCEEMSGLFVALCRASNIPARCVWIPEHCYPEFYLEDANGFGHWYPCQVAGDRQFGSMQDYRPILQKGDRFKVPEHQGLQRYVAEFFTCKQKTLGPTPPNVVTIRDLGELTNELAAIQAATEPKAAEPAVIEPQ